jgi:hypothetical protein
VPKAIPATATATANANRPLTWPPRLRDRGRGGTILITQQKVKIEDSLAGFGIPKGEADSIADSLSESGGGDSAHFAGETGKQEKEIFDSVQVDFAQAMEIVFYAMAGVMALAFIVALLWMPGGLAEPGSADGT